MKEAIKEYLTLTEEEKSALWNKAVFVFDTNIFLNLYRYTAETRKTLLDAMQHFSERIWMPKQVAQELMKDRPKVIFDTFKIFDDLKKEKEKFIQNCTKKLRRKEEDENIKKMSEVIDKHIEKLKKASNYIEKVDDDEVLNRLLLLFEHKVGKGFSEDELETIKKEGAERYNKQIPPGYKDAEKGGENNVYGDLIIWKEILEFAKSNKKDIIYVTGDQKEDWWHKEGNQTLGPRTELKKEFFEESDQAFYMYSMDRFLTQFKDVQGSRIEQRAIDEVKNYEKNLGEKHKYIIYKRYRKLEIHKIENEIHELEQLLIDLDDEQKGLESRIDITRQELLINEKNNYNTEGINNLLEDLKRLQSYLEHIVSKKAMLKKRIKDFTLQKDRLINNFDSEL